MVNRLEVPDPRARIGAQGHDRVGEQVVAQALATVVVVTGTTRRNEDQVAGDVGHDDRPCVGAASAPGRAVLPGVRANRVWILRNGIPTPEQLSRDRVEGAHFTARMGLVGAIGDGRPDDNRVTDHGGW